MRRNLHRSLNESTELARLASNQLTHLKLLIRDIETSNDDWDVIIACVKASLAASGILSVVADEAVDMNYFSNQQVERKLANLSHAAHDTFDKILKNSTFLGSGLYK